MTKRIIALILCLTMVAGLIPAVSAAPIRVEHTSRDQCCQTQRVNPLNPNYVRPAYEGMLIDITPQRVEDTFNYLNEHYVQNHPEQALMVYTGTAEDKEVLMTLAETITAGCTTDKEKADAIDRWLYRNIYYDIGTSAYASDTFYRREGNCLSYANLMQFLLRSLGIPAVIGDGWRGDMKTSTVDLFNMEGHAWVFVLLDGEWVLYDPLWIEGGTTDRDYMAEWIYFDTVETICPASDGDNLPPEAYDKPKPYYTDGKFYTWSEFHGNTMGNLTLFLNNQAYAYIANQCEGDIGDGMCYLDGRDKSGMERGELYRNGWASYGDYNENAAMHVSYYFPNGMTADGYVATLDGKDRFMYTNTSNEVLAPEYDIIDGYFTLKPGYDGPFLALSWQDGVMDSYHEYITTWESLNPEIVSVDQSGNITCHQEGYADIQVTMQRVENNGNLTHLAGRRLSVLVSSEERIPDYTDYQPHEHEYVFDYAVAATCEDWGYDVHKCVYCPVIAEVYTQEPLGHDYVSGICTRCGAEDPNWEAPAEVASGTCGDNLTWVLTEDGTLTISGTGDMSGHASVPDGAAWYAYRDQILSVEIQEGATSIGHYAFSECSTLTSVTIPASVLAIGQGAFYKCVALPQLELPTGLTEIPRNALNMCESLTELEIPASVESIGIGAFWGCSSLTQLELPAGLKELGSSAFGNCDNLTHMSIPEGITEIPWQLFVDCYRLESVTFPSTVTSIDQGTFLSCPALREFVIPEGVTIIPAQMFMNCYSLSSVTIPDSITQIGAEAFKDTGKLTTLTLPAALTTIGDQAFVDSGIMELVIPAGVSSIGSKAFYSSSMSEITFLGSAPTTIGTSPMLYLTVTAYYPGYDVTWTEEVRSSFGDSITWVPYEGNTEVASGTCGENLTWVLAEDGTLTISGTGAMYDYEYMEAPWCAYLENILQVVIQDGATRIGNNAFREAVNITAVSLSDTITEIGSWAFMGAEKLTAITLPQNLVTLEQEAFMNCVSLEAIELPGTLTFIDAGICTGCSSLTKAVIRANPNTPSLVLGNSPFRYCTSLEEIQVEEGHFALKSIDGVLYTYSGDVLSVLQYPLGRRDPVWNIPEGTVDIGQLAAEQAQYLEEVYIPDTVNEIWPFAFSGSQNLRSVCFAGDAPMIKEYAFSLVEAEITYPAGNETWTADVMQDYGGTITWVAYEETQGNECGENLTWELQDNGTLIISGVGPMYDYAAGEAPWYADRDKIRNVIVSEGVTTIGDHAFHGLTNVGRTALAPAALCIHTVSDGGFHLPDTLRIIGTGAFAGCSGMTEILLPVSVAVIGDDAFDSCTALEQITFLGDAPEIGDNAFENVNAQVSYPTDNETWTDEVKENYGGTITWESYEPNFVKWYSGTTSLNGTIDLNIYVLLSRDLVNADDTYVRFIYDGQTVEVPMAEALHAPTDKYPNRYRFSCPIYAKQLADNVTVKFMKGDEQVGKDLNYSVVKYCVNQIAKVTNPQELALYKAMLNYGAAAQLMFDHNIENLANASLSEADKVLPTVDASAYKYSISGKEEGIRAKSATLMLEDVVKVRVYFALTGDKTIEDYTFTINGQVVTPSQNEKGYYVETSGIAAKDLEKMFSIQVGGITVKYGALSYVNSKANGSDELEANISKALFVYWQAAESYLG